MGTSIHEGSDSGDNQPQYLIDLAELEASGSLDQVANLIETRAEIWIKRTSGEWQVGQVFASNHDKLTVSVRWFDEARQKNVGKVVDTADFLRWQDEQQHEQLPSEQRYLILASREAIADADRFRNETEVNGVKIECHWDSDYENYVLYFPQMPYPSGDLKIMDQLFRMDEDPELARKTYEYAVSLAKNGGNMYDIYKASENFVRKLQYGA